MDKGEVGEEAFPREDSWIFSLYAVFMKVHCVTEKDALDFLNIIDV